MMKDILSKAAAIVCLVSPLLANANTLAGSSPFDSFSFTLLSSSNVAIDYAWSDMLVTKNRNTVENNATSLGWTLTGPTPLSATFSDVTGTTAGTGTISLLGLASGSYTLKLAGVWGSVTQSTGAWSSTPGAVNLWDGDVVGGVAERNSFTATAITPVPEPESYAMLLAGLGLIGVVIRRRQSGQA